MQLIAYGLIALAILGAIGTGVYKVKEWGADGVRLEWKAANEKAAKEAEAERARQDALRQAQDKEVTRRLTDAKRRNTGLMASLEAHIRASGTAAQCPLSPGLHDIWNRANQGPQSDSPGAVHDGSRKPAPSR